MDDEPRKARDTGGLKTEELTAIINEIRDRVRARHPNGSAASTGVPLPDLMPILHARDAAEAKVASIGHVNPRPPGLINNAIQAFKKTVARSLNWFVRDQVEFNRGVMVTIQAILEALDENNRALSMAIGRTNDAVAEAKELKDIRAHWAEWRLEWERKLATNEMQFLRSVADLQAAFQHRVTLMESNFRELTESKLKTQNADFHLALERSIIEIQQRLWADLDRIKTEFERLIHNELRVVRQRAMIQTAPGVAPAATAATSPEIPAIPFDYEKFADRFRGTAEYVKEKQRFYLPHFEGCKEVLDIGCGRGEFLELLRDAGISGRGIDLSDESVALCRSKGLEAEKADLFEHLENLPEYTLDGIFCAQVIEHIPPARLPEMIRLCATRLARGGVLVIETPNPECLAIFATHFYLDPTHHRPVPIPLLVFYLEEFGMGHLDVHRLSPAVESMAELASLPEDFRNAFFGALDYAIIARRL